MLVCDIFCLPLSVMRFVCARCRLLISVLDFVCTMGLSMSGSGCLWVLVLCMSLLLSSVAGLVMFDHVCICVCGGLMACVMFCIYGVCWFSLRFCGLFVFNPVVVV